MPESKRIAEPDRKQIEDYSGFWEYFNAELAPQLNETREPPVNIGYANLKRRP